jgi:hypothetical protein
LLSEGWKVHRDDLPHEFEVDPEVLRNQEVSESRYVFPWDAGSECLTARADSLGRLCESLEISPHRVLHQSAGKEGVPAIRNIQLNAADALQKLPARSP